MRHILRLFLIVLVFTGIGVMNIGGCGGGGGGNGGGGFTPLCNMPPFTTDFSNVAYFFIDLDRGLDLGVSSDSEFVAISFFDIGTDDGVFFVADVTGNNECEIFGITDLDLVLPASGTCFREDDGGVFGIENLNAVGIFVPFVEGDCDEVVVLNVASAEQEAFSKAFDAVKSQPLESKELEGELKSRLQKALGK